MPAERADIRREASPVARSSPLIAAVLAAHALTAPALAQPATTVVTHGYSTSATESPWVEEMADAVIARSGGGAVCRYRAIDGAWELVSGALDDESPTALIFLWLEDFEKAGPNLGFAEGAADALYAALRDPTFVDGGGGALPAIDLVHARPLHLIGHSRGTCVNSEVAERFGRDGLTVDHVTTLDPHPVNGTLDPPISPNWGDPVPVQWSNIVFADNYWRADGGFFNALDFDGMPIPGALDGELDEDALNCCAYGFAHSDVHLWYHGTIDLAPAPCDGEQCIDAEMRSSWWPGGWEEQGYWYSALGGGAGARPPQGPGTAPGAVASLYNGSFAGAALAGWLYHGGEMNGTVTSGGGATYLSLGAGSGSSARHNRFLLPADTGRLLLDTRVTTASAANDLEIALVDAEGFETLIGTFDLAASTGWVVDRSVVIPALVERERVHQLVLRLTGGALSAVVNVDNLRFAPPDPCAADFDESGDVGFSDLTALLIAWGTCAQPCAHDLDGDGQAGFSDLTAVLIGWGACP